MSLFFFHDLHLHLIFFFTSLTQIPINRTRNSIRNLKIIAIKLPYCAHLNDALPIRVTSPSQYPYLEYLKAVIMEAEYLNMQLVSVDRIFDALPPNTCIKTLNLHYNLLQDLKGLKNMHSYVKNITEINISSNRFCLSYLLCNHLLIIIFSLS